jgi:hypothetical protein
MSIKHRKALITVAVVSPACIRVLSSRFLLADFARSPRPGSEESSPSRKSVACITLRTFRRLIRNSSSPTIAPRPIRRRLELSKWEALAFRSQSGGRLGCLSDRRPIYFSHQIMAMLALLKLGSDGISSSDTRRGRESGDAALHPRGKASATCPAIHSALGLVVTPIVTNRLRA